MHSELDMVLQEGNEALMTLAWGEIERLSPNMKCMVGRSCGSELPDKWKVKMKIHE